MSIADPIWPDRSLRDNPFLKDYFDEQDRMNEVQASISNLNSDSSNSSSDNSPRIENNNSCQKNDNPFIDSVRAERDSYQDISMERKDNPFICHDKSKDNDLGARIIQVAMDPFEETWDIDRMTRVLILANEFKKDEKGRTDRKEHNTETDQKTSGVKQEVWDYVTDPTGDFGSLDPARLKRVEALAKVIPQENHLIQIETSKSKNFSNQIRLDRSEDIQTEPDIKNRIQHHNEQRGLIKKGVQKVEHFIEKHIPKVDYLQFNGKISQQIIKSQNKMQDQKIQNFENIIRGVNDYVVWQCNGLLSSIPGLKHSSKEFYDHHKMGKKGLGLENSFYYWMGAATGIASEFVLLKGRATAANIGRQAMQKVGNALIKAGIQGAVHSKLVTGGIGEGIVPYLPRGFGGTAIVGKESTSLIKGFSEAALFKAAETISKVIKNSPDVLKKTPELAKFINKPITNARDFLEGLFPFTKTALDSHVFKNLANQATVLPEIDSIANHAIAEIARDTAASQEIFADFSSVLDALDNPARGFQEYIEFIHRHEMRQFARDMGCPEEVLPYIMKKVPKRESCTASALERLVSNILIAQDNIKYCNKHVKDPWIRDKLLQLSLPLQKHYIYSYKKNESGDTNEFKKILDKYGLDLNQHWNLLLIPRRPVVADDYHDWVLSELESIHQEIVALEHVDELEKRKLFLELFQTRIKDVIRSNPLICAHKWYRFWKKNKQVFEQNLEKQIQTVGDEISNPASLANIKPIEKVADNAHHIKPTYKLHKDLQFKHFKEGGAIKHKKSLVYWNYEKIIQKTEPMMGKGIAVRGSKLGDEGFQEVIKFDEICGECYLDYTEKWEPTPYAKIHYKLNGLYHIVPANPNGEAAKKWDNLYGNS